MKRPTSEAVVRRCSVKFSQNSQEETCKIDLKINLKINLKLDSSTVVFSCESCEIFKKQQTAALLLILMQHTHTQVIRLTHL